MISLFYDVMFRWVLLLFSYFGFVFLSVHICFPCFVFDFFRVWVSHFSRTRTFVLSLSYFRAVFGYRAFFVLVLSVVFGFRTFWVSVIFALVVFRIYFNLAFVSAFGFFALQCS